MIKFSYILELCMGRKQSREMHRRECENSAEQEGVAQSVQRDCILEAS